MWFHLYLISPVRLKISPKIYGDSFFFFLNLPNHSAQILLGFKYLSLPKLQSTWQMNKCVSIPTLIWFLRQSFDTGLTDIIISLQMISVRLREVDWFSWSHMLGKRFRAETSNYKWETLLSKSVVTTCTSVTPQPYSLQITVEQVVLLCLIFIINVL